MDWSRGSPFTRNSSSISGVIEHARTPDRSSDLVTAALSQRVPFEVSLDPALRLGLPEPFLSAARTDAIFHEIRLSCRIENGRRRHRKSRQAEGMPRLIGGGQLDMANRWPRRTDRRERFRIWQQKRVE